MQNASAAPLLLEGGELAELTEEQLGSPPRISRSTMSDGNDR